MSLPYHVTVYVKAVFRPHCDGCRPPCHNPRHVITCPECNSVDMAVLSHRAGDSCVIAQCVEAHEWPTELITPAEFREAVRRWAIGRG